MVPQQEYTSRGVGEICLSLELECSRRFGDNKYSFYFPIHLQNFVITCWKTQISSSSTSSDNLMSAASSSVVQQPSNSYTVTHKDYSINYSSGNNFNANPNKIANASATTTSSDRYCCTIYEDGEIILPVLDVRMKGFSWAKSFSKKTFSKEELECLLSDIYQFCCFSH